MKIITVVPFKKGLLKEKLTYFSSKDIPLGSIVDVSIRNKQVLGLVVGLEDVVKAKGSIKDMTFDLKKISGIKERSIIQPKFLESILEATKYYIENINIAVNSLLPKVILEKHDEFVSLANKKNELITDKIYTSERLIFQRSKGDRIEYYKTFIRSSFAEKKSVFLVVPTQNNTEEWFGNLSKGIEKFVIKLHGGLTKSSQISKIEEIIKSEHPLLVISTVPYLSIIDEKFKTIILENESSDHYNMMFKPYFDLRFFVEILANKINSKLILGDTLLRFETIARADLEKTPEVQNKSFRINFNGSIEIIKKSQKENKESVVIGEEVLNKVKESLLKKEKSFLFNLRKGISPYTVCRSCGETVSCKNCSSPMILYKSSNNKNIFVCNKCGEKSNTEIKCAVCKSWDLLPLGMGIDFVHQELSKKIKSDQILLLDKENVKTKSGVSKILKEFQENNSILLGTELALIYLNEKVDNSVIISFDSLWSIPNYKMNEKILQLLIRIIEKTNKSLIIQTKNTEDSLLLAVKNLNLNTYIKEELEDRKNMGYPPFKRFIKITIPKKILSVELKEFIKETFNKYEPVFYESIKSHIAKGVLINILIRVNYSNWNYGRTLEIDEILLSKIIDLKNKIPDIRVKVDPESLF